MSDPAELAEITLRGEVSVIDSLRLIRAETIEECARELEACDRAGSAEIVRALKEKS